MVCTMKFRFNASLTSSTVHQMIVDDCKNPVLRDHAECAWSVNGEQAPGVETHVFIDGGVNISLRRRAAAGGFDGRGTAHAPPQPPSTQAPSTQPPSTQPPAPPPRKGKGRGGIIVVVVVFIVATGTVQLRLLQPPTVRGLRVKRAVLRPVVQPVELHGVRREWQRRRPVLPALRRGVLRQLQFDGVLPLPRGSRLRRLSREGDAQLRRRDILASPAGVAAGDRVE